MSVDRAAFLQLFAQQGCPPRSLRLVKPATLLVEFAASADAERIFLQLQGNPALRVYRHLREPQRLRITCLRKGE